MRTSIFGTPIAFSPALAKYLGDINAALMLSQAIYWRGRSTAHETQFYKSQDEWEEETTLNAHAQRKAREILSEYDWWHEERRGIPCRLWYDVHERELRRQFFAWQDAQESGSDGNLTSSPQCEELETDNVDNKGSTSSTTNTESTTESTNNTTTSAGDAYDTEPINSHGRDPVDDPEEWNQPKFLKAWEDLHGEKLLTFSQYGNDPQRQKALDHIRRYWTADEVREAFKKTKAKDSPWAYFCRILEIMAAGKYDDGSDTGDFFGLFD